MNSAPPHPTSVPRLARAYHPACAQFRVTMQPEKEEGDPHCVRGPPRDVPAQCRPAVSATSSSWSSSQPSSLRARLNLLLPARRPSPRPLGLRPVPLVPSACTRTHPQGCRDKLAVPTRDAMVFSHFGAGRVAVPRFRLGRSLLVWPGRRDPGRISPPRRSESGPSLPPPAGADAHAGPRSPPDPCRRRPARRSARRAHPTLP